MKSFNTAIMLGITCISLSACGGGGGGTASTPTPPPPSAPTNASLVDLQYDEMFTNSGNSLTVTIQKSTGFTSRIGESSNFTPANIQYNRSSNSYTVNMPSAVTFRPSDKDLSESTSAVTVYTRDSGSTTRSLVLFNPGPTNPSLALTYTSYGAWQQIVDNSSSVTMDLGFFAYGVETPPANMPRTGTADYQTIVDGFWTDANGAYVLAGNSSLSADFANNSVTSQLDLAGVNVLTGGTRALDIFNGTGTISGSSFHVNFDGIVTNYTGRMDGYFFGPQAQEVGGSFVLTGDGGRVIGAVVGKQ